MDAFLSGAGGAKVSNGTLLIPQPDGTYLAQFADETGQPGMGWTAVIGADGQMIGEPKMAPIYQGSGINNFMSNTFGGPKALLAPLAAWGIGSALGLGEGAAALGGASGGAGLGADASLLAAENGIFGSTVGMGTGAGAGGTAGAAGGLGTAASGAGGSSLLGGAASLLGGNSGIGSLLGGAAGLLSSANAPDSETVTQQRTVDPRVDAALWGQNGQGGLFNMLMSELQKGPNAGTRAAWGVANNYFGAR
jgi:hypothetical protein